jgi:hypothetical protein
VANLIHRAAVALVAVAALAGFMTVVPWQQTPRTPGPVGYGPVAEVADTAGLDLPLRDQATTVARMSSVTITQPPVNLTVGQAEHSAFPGLARLDDGRLRLVWRQGKDHYASRDGDIMSALSIDDGVSYGNVRTVRTGGDYRDPSVSLVDGTEHLTWFTGSSVSPALGAFTQQDGWAPTARINGLPYAAICAPLVKLPDGRLGAAFYGRKDGESIDTAWMGWSVDNGLHWSTNRIANSIGAGVAHNEPWLVVDGELTHFFYRWGNNDGIGLNTSTDSGASGSWGGSHKILSNATGRPSVTRAEDGTLVMVYRERTTGAARIAYSEDHAVTWLDGGVLMAKKGGLGMTYAAMVPDADGTGLVGVLGMEESNGGGAIVSKLYGFRLAA